MAFATRSGGRILHAQTYPLQEVDAEEGDGRLIRGGRLIRTIRYVKFPPKSALYLYGFPIPYIQENTNF